MRGIDRLFKISHLDRNRLNPALLIELAVGLGCLVAANLFWWPDIPAFQGVAPHPYWLLILPMAVHYGIVEGALASLACLALYAAWTWSIDPEPYWILFFTFERLKTPVFFLVGGLVCGEFRERHRRYENKLVERLEKVENAFHDLTAQHLAVTDAKRELEVRILSQDQTVQTIYNAAEGLDQLDEQGIYPSVLKIMSDNLGVTASSIYMVNEGRLVRVAQIGDIDTPEEMPFDQGVMGLALKNKRVESVNTYLPDTDGEGETQILISGPLVQENGDLIGVINIHRLPFLRFTPGTIRMVGMLTEWTSLAIGNARKFMKVAERDLGDDLSGTHSTNYLNRRLGEEFSRSRRYGTTMSIILAQIERFDEVDEQFFGQLMSTMGGALTKSLRNVDLVFRGQEPSQFVLLLPVTPIAGCQLVIDRIRTELNAFKLRPYSGSEDLFEFKLGGTEIAPRIKDVNGLLQAAEENLT